MLETESSERQQVSTPCQNQLRGFKKWASSNHDQNGSHKWPKTAEPEENQWPETAATFQIDTDTADPLPAEVADTDLVDPLPAKVAGTGQLMEVAGRTWHVMDLQWGTSQWDNSFNGNAKDDNNDNDRDNENGNDDDKDGDESGDIYIYIYIDEEVKMEMRTRMRMRTVTRTRMKKVLKDQEFLLWTCARTLSVKLHL